MLIKGKVDFISIMKARGGMDMYSYCYVDLFLLFYALFCIFCFHCANWHSPTTLTEVFPCFLLSCKTNARVYSQRRAWSALFLISELCCSVHCLCRLCCSMYCLYVNVYCTIATGWQTNCS
jgi:hypothetical protein